MSSRIFNGSTLTFSSAAIARLVGLHYKCNGQVVDVTEPSDLTKLSEVGQPDLEVTASVKRMPAVTVGATGTLAISWNDGSTTTLPSNWIVTSVGGGGNENSPITGDITFKPTITGDTYEYGATGATGATGA